MNRCKACGEPAPDGYDLCWSCRHMKKLPAQEPEAEECESCRIDLGDRENSGLLEDET